MLTNVERPVQLFISALMRIEVKETPCSFWRRNSNSGSKYLEYFSDMSETFTFSKTEHCVELERWQGLPHVKKKV